MLVDEASRGGGRRRRRRRFRCRASVTVLARTATVLGTSPSSGRSVADEYGEDIVPGSLARGRVHDGCFTEPAHTGSRNSSGRLASRPARSSERTSGGAYRVFAFAEGGVIARLLGKDESAVARVAVRGGPAVPRAVGGD